MKLSAFITPLCGLLMSTLLTCPNYTLADAKDAKDNGTLTIFNPKGNPCVYEIKNTVMNIDGRGNCGLGKGHFELHNAPSATHIWFTTYVDYPYGPPVCKIDDRQLLKSHSASLLTIKEPTTVDKTAVKDLSTLAPGTVVKPGLRLLSYSLNDDDAHCLIIETYPLIP
jgi:hypothetical protein